MMIKRAILAVLLATVPLFACSAGGKSEKAAEVENASGGGSTSTAAGANAGADVDVSYAFGVALGSDLKQTGIAFDYGELLKGIQDQMEGKDLRFTLEEAIGKIQTAYTTVMQKRAEDNLREGAAFLAENSKKAGVITTSSGLQYEVVLEGTGSKPGPQSTVEVHYEGTLLDGTVFDSSYARDEPVQFPVDRVIPGWAEGVQLMSVGSTYKLYIPAELGYGEQGPGEIPPNATLIFKVELLSIVQ
jgi:FKBP-type peptidyl-prolyl cis-trans isomerase